MFSSLFMGKAPSFSTSHQRPDLTFEKRATEAGYLAVVGIDEAGRGPLAGPVSAAAVLLPEEFAHAVLNDSKKLSEKKRENLFKEFLELPDLVWGHSFGEAEEIDRINILQATHAAMARAVAQIPQADYALIDGRAVKGFPLSSEGIVKGDSKSLSIAAASIIAKVLRDHKMMEYHDIFPHYGFAQHKGYGTRAHLAALEKYGPCPIHRRSFAPVAAAAARHR